MEVNKNNLNNNCLISPSLSLNHLDLLEKFTAKQKAWLKEFATINDMVIAPKNTCIGTDDVYMAGFGLPQLDKYVKRLLEHGYTVPVIVQDIQGKNTTRSLACIYSPGTYFNNNDINESFDNDNNNPNNGLSNNTICIWVHLTNSSIINKEPFFIKLLCISFFK